MFKIQQVPLADLLLDTRNARLADPQPDQSTALLALAKEQGENLINLAEDIVTQGMLNPLEIPGVVPLDGEGPPYVVLEGNRRFAALRILESPDLVKVVFDDKVGRRIDALHRTFIEQPVEEVLCAIFEAESELEHWIDLRHTGKNEGRGLAQWGPGQQDRHKARHGGTLPAPRSQVEDFVVRGGKLSAEAQAENRSVLSTIERVINNDAARKRLGISIVKGEVRAHFPAAEVLRGLTRLVDDLKQGIETSRSLNSAGDIQRYVKALDAADIPDPASKLKEPVALHVLTAALPNPETKPKKKARGKADPSKRHTAVPSGTSLGVTDKRARKIFDELLTLKADKFPNAAGVLFRVFLEISCDHYLEKEKVGTWNGKLGHKMTQAAEHMKKAGTIDDSTFTMIRRSADKKSFFDASVGTFHQWVHNRKVSPQLPEIVAAWDELYPFYEALWP